MTDRCENWAATPSAVLCLSNGMQWLPVVCCQFLLGIILVLCRWKKVSYKFILCKHTHVNTPMFPVMAHISIPSPLSRKVGQMLQVVQHAKSSHIHTHPLCSSVWVGSHWIQPPASQWQPHIHRDLSKCKSAVFTQQHTRNLLCTPQNTRCSRAQTASQAAGRPFSSPFPFICALWSVLIFTKFTFNWELI